MRQRLRWSGWFAGTNTLVFLSIALIYFLSTLPIDFYLIKPSIQAYIWFYITITYLGHFGLLAGLAWVLLLPFTLLPRWIFFPLAVLLMSASTLLLFTDAKIFTLFGSHLNKFFMDVIFDPNLRHFLNLGDAEYRYIAMLIISIILLESLLAFGLWRFWLKKPAYRNAKPAMVFLLCCLSLSWGITLLSIPITPRLAKQAAVLPLFNPILNRLLWLVDSNQNLDTLGNDYIPMVPKFQGRLAYPLHPLVTTPQQKPKNIVLIIIDSWRFNTVKQDVMPHTTEFAKAALQFQTHYAGANSTGPGIFNLFYSLPYTYWSAMLAQKQGPVFFKTLQAANYDLAVFASSTLKLPAFDKTVFVDIPHLQADSRAPRPVEADRAVTRDAITFLNQQSSQKPFLAVLYYDMAHSYCADFDFPTPFQPMDTACNRMTYTNETDPTPYLNRYLNALHFIDNELQSVYANLDKNNQLDNTVVIITGDHGQEFNDSHTNAWDHARHFTRYQIQTPLIIRWPGMTAASIQRPTSHYDVVPTLMRHLQGVSNPFTDYAIGQDLFEKHAPGLLFLSGYLYPGWIETDHIVSWYQSGKINLADLEGHPEPGAEVSTQSVKEVLRLVTQYYQEG